ncbi:MAG: alpha/beta fold hydrolase [Saprospiraceae bacterium]
MTIKNIIFFSLTILLLASCTKRNTDTYERFYFKTSDGADLAVQVDGDRNSNTFILLLHGGPGGSGYEYNTGEFTERMESKYAMVYLDQRGQGASQGNYETVTLQRFSDDVYELTMFLKEKYGQDISIFVMGHSWGGTTGTHAMLNTDIQNEIKGWIESNGAHDIPLLNKEAIKMFIEIGNDEIAAGNNVSDWQEIVDFAEAVDTNNITEDEGGQINGFGFTAEGLIEGVTQGEYTGASHGLATSPILSLSAYLSGNLTASAIMGETEKAAMTDELHNIMVPTLLLWGKYDFVVPPALGESAYANIGTTDKKLVIFDFSGHSPMDNEAATFADEVEEFVELYK